METNTPINKKKNISWIIIVAVVAAIALITGIVIYTRSVSGTRGLQEQLNLGYKYLSELEYEKAVAAFDAVLQIDPKNSSALEGLTDTYLAWANAVADDGDISRALEILREGLGKTGSSLIEDRIRELEQLSDDSSGDYSDISDNEEENADNDLTQSYIALAEDILRLIDYPILDRTAADWTFREITALTANQETYGGYVVANSRDFDGNIVNISLYDKDGDYYFDFSAWDSGYGTGDETHHAVFYSRNSIPVSDYPMLGMTEKEYLESFGLGDQYEQSLTQKLDSYDDDTYSVIIENGSITVHHYMESGPYRDICVGVYYESVIDCELLIQWMLMW
jgi:tetratricopeptide (TPR) repeat protein